MRKKQGMVSAVIYIYVFSLLADILADPSYTPKPGAL